MGNTTKGNVLMIAPQFKDLEGFNDLYALVAADVAESITTKIYGSQQERAQRYMIAHLITLSGVFLSSNGTQAAGPITADKSGDISVSYGAMRSFAGDPQRLDETVYGRVFMTIRVRTIPNIRTITPNGIG